MRASGTPQRPARGLPPEQALERWSDPDAYAAMREYWDFRGSCFFVFTGPPSEGELEYDRRRRPLEETFLERLQLGELMASAIPENADVTAPRTLLDPEIFSIGSLMHEHDMIVGLPGGNLSHVEIFEPPSVPRNVRVIPDWYREQLESAQTVASGYSTDGMTQQAASFRQIADYRQVWINSVDFTLTRTQAKVVKLLREAQLRGDPWQFGQRVLADAGSGSTRMVHVFRAHKAPPWSVLTESDGRGHYRLNISE